MTSMYVHTYDCFSHFNSYDSVLDICIYQVPWVRHPLALNSQSAFIHSFNQAISIISASSSPLQLRGASDAAWILCRSFTPRRHRQLQAKDLPKVPMWWVGVDSTNEPPRPTSSYYMDIYIHIN